jgi:hypothetical protein
MFFVILQKKSSILYNKIFVKKEKISKKVKKKRESFV